MRDQFSNFIEIILLDDTRVSVVIKKIKGHFDSLVTDNELQFTCENFKRFTSEWGFDVHLNRPGHQQANDTAESAVKTVKRLLRKAKASGRVSYLALLTLLHTIAEFLKPQGINVETTKESKRLAQAKMAHYYNRQANYLEALEEGGIVRMVPFTLHKKAWKRAIVRKRFDEILY